MSERRRKILYTTDGSGKGACFMEKGETSSVILEKTVGLV